MIYKLLFFIFLILFSAVLPAAEQRAETVREFAAVNRVELRQLSLRLTVRSATMTGIRTKLIGSEKQLENVLLRHDGDTLTVSERNPGGAAERRFSDDDGNVVIVSGSGSSTVTINGRTWRSGDANEAPLELIIDAAPRTELTVRGFAGSGTLSGDLRLPLLEVGVGELQVDLLDDSELRVIGSGAVAAAAASGSLRLTLDGSGEVTLRRAALARLDAALRGSGSIDVGGAVETARLAVSGSGSIYVERIAERPQVELSGSGSIDVGNWR